eukprot:g11132.t1
MPASRVVRSRSVPMVHALDAATSPAAAAPVASPLVAAPVSGSTALAPALVRVATASSAVAYSPPRPVRAVVRAASPPPTPPVSAPPTFKAAPMDRLSRGDSPYVRYRAVKLPASSVLTQRPRRV